MELGEYNDKPCEFALDEMIHEIILASQEEYSQKGLHIETALEPFSIYADSIHFQRIITNILDNSLKYKTKETGHMKISLRQTTNGHQLSFADDGPGVPEDALPHLFEVFYRSDPARQNAASKKQILLLLQQSVPLLSLPLLGLWSLSLVHKIKLLA